MRFEFKEKSDLSVLHYSELLSLTELTFGIESKELGLQSHESGLDRKQNQLCTHEEKL